MTTLWIMRRLTILLFAGVTATSLSSCGFVHDEKLVGPYRLVAIDVDEQMRVSVDVGNGSALGIISETVFSVGWDDTWMVAKQHPKGDKSITNYFYFRHKHGEHFVGDHAVVIGPLTLAEFEEAKKEHGLPEFSRTLKHLE